MFNQLAPLVGASEKVVLTLAMNGDMLSVVVMPVVKKADDPALGAPLAISGTPTELDEGFAEVLRSYTTTRQSLVEQVEATNSILEAAKANQSSKATKALAKAATSASDASSSDRNDEGDDEADAKPRDPISGASPTGSAGTDLASFL
ncbi:PRTRC genetic system protein E [Cupriavidus gilardii J11]|uniref:PRTRC genetic system protein E n=1 Tax=Cupriavidus gilardii J11 TaxID=936133 RepID=A0A562BRI4_9BURK|nr:PRTRC system protein E [Cupriavidus gilardii]TWG87888.1 PRTRC genetic system protein E [Cupriavidus gilardii J11]